MQPIRGVLLLLLSLIAMEHLAYCQTSPINPCLAILEKGADGETGLFDIYKIESDSKFDRAFREWLLLDEASRHDIQKATSLSSKGGYGAIWGQFAKTYS